MQNPDPASRSRIIHLVIAKRKKSILKAWIQENGIPYKCVEMLYAIMDRKPVYAHEQETKRWNRSYLETGYCNKFLTFANEDIEKDSRI